MSLLAIIEVIIAVTLYWWIAVYFNTYLHLIISVFIAPFLLLRSEDSIFKGLLFLEKGVCSTRSCKQSIRYLLEVLIGIGLFCLTFFLFETYIDIEDIIFTIFMLFACSGFGIGLGLGLFGVWENQRIGFISILIVLSTSIYVKGLQILPHILAIIVFSLILLLFKKYGKGVLGIIAATFLGIGVAFGLILVLFIYKAMATFQYIINGFNNIIENWKYSNFVIDIRATPEIIFGIEKYDGLNEYKLSRFMDSHKGNDMIELFATTAMYMILYPFAIMYRWSIKGTFWFYIPLLILVKSPSCRRRLHLDTSPELMWTVCRKTCGHPAGEHKDS
jgi:hypothetical protein